MKSTMKLVENSVKNFCCDGIDNFRQIIYIHLPLDISPKSDYTKYVFGLT